MDKTKQQKSARGLKNSADMIDRMLEVAAKRIKAFYGKLKSPIKKRRPK